MDGPADRVICGSLSCFFCLPSGDLQIHHCRRYPPPVPHLPQPNLVIISRALRSTHAAMSLSASPAPFLFLLLMFLLPVPPCQPESQRSEPSSSPDLWTLSPSLFPFSFPPSVSYGKSNTSSPKSKCERKVSNCTNGILLPVWEPIQPEFGEQVARAVVYFVSLMYMFLGVSIIADRFMASIEVITSQVRAKYPLQPPRLTCSLGAADLQSGNTVISKSDQNVI